MFKIIVPLLFILGSILVIGVFIFPAWQHFIVVRGDIKRLQELDFEIDGLNRKRDEITDRISKISKDDFARLDQILPPSAQGPEFLVILQNFAVAHNLQVSKLELLGQLSTQPRIASDVLAVTTTSGLAVVGGSGTGVQTDQYRTISANIDITGPYDSFKAFLRDIESYTRITNIVALQIGSGVGAKTESGSYNYRVSVQTYYKFGS